MKNSTKKTKTFQPKLKIGFVIDDSMDRMNNGVQQYVKTLGKWLESQGHTVNYMTSGSKQSENVFSMSKNFAVRFNKNRLTIPYPANKTAIKLHLEKHNYDILHIQMPFNPLMAGRVIKSAASSVGIVGTFHILPFGEFQKFANKSLAFSQKTALRRFDAICSVSPAAAEFAKNQYKISSRVIPNMLDPKIWQSHVSLHPYRIVFLGRLVPRKGCFEFLKALNLLSEDIKSNLEVIICSDGPERNKLSKYVESNNMNFVKFIGFVSETEKVNLLASAQVAVFPSLGGESFGIVLIEAMAAGAGVVIGGNNPGYASVLGKWPETLVDPKNTIEFSDTLKLFISNKNLSKNIHNQQKLSVNQYYVDQAGPKILDMYYEALLLKKKDVR